MSLRTQHHL
uniref:Uncharacterized protein n=1 Tax=Arundo donax TaxID=35708 RepID=A0A0A9BFN7_ARUDO